MDLSVNSSGEKRSPRVNLPRSLRDVIEDVKWMESVLEKSLARIRRLQDEIFTIERVLGEKRARRREHRSAVPPGPAPTAQNYHFAEGQKRGQIAVSFDGGKSVSLPRALAELASVLASDEGKSPDQCVAFKSFARLCELLGKRSGRKYNNHTVSQLLTRLRREFQKVSLDPRLIESSKFGVRLRLKRSPMGLYAG